MKHAQFENQEPVAWNEPTPDFYITELSRNTIRFHNAVHGKQEFSKLQMNDCIVPVWFTTSPQRTEPFFKFRECEDSQEKNT